MTESSPVKINTVPFKEQMNAILTGTNTDTLIQGSVGRWLQLEW